MPTWLMLTLPSLVFALAMALLTPRLDSLAGFLESLCIPVTMLCGVPAMLLLLRSQRDELKPKAVYDAVARTQIAALEIAKGWEALLVAGVFFGVGLLLLIFSETVYSIAYETDYSGRFFCDVVAR